MFKNNLKIAFRSLFRNKFYSALNITGLAIGIAACLLIVLYVTDELSYDKYYPKSERTYRLTANGALNGNNFDLAVVGAPVGQALVNDYPQVEQFARFRDSGSRFIRFGDNVFKEESYVWADNSVLEVFNFEFIEGNRETALLEPRSLVINETTAKKFFGEESALDKVVQVGGTEGFKITGVFKDTPKNTHFDFNVLGSMETLDEAKQTIWLSMNFVTYIVLAENASPDDLAATFPALLEKYIGPEVKQFMNLDWDQMGESGGEFNFGLQPVSSIHLTSDLQAELGQNSDIKYVYIFSAIAFFILLIACINFMNLATARSARRAKEVGVRKVLGSLKGQLINQFLVESLLVSAVSFFLALGIAYAVLPFFNTLANKDLIMPFSNPSLYGGMAAGILFVGFLAGSYPAFFLSAFQPVKVLKGALSGGMKSGRLRSILVVVQFGASIFLVIATLVVLQQLDFIQNKKLGFEKDQVMVVHDAYLAGNNVQTLKEQMTSLPEVKSASLTSYLPTPSSRNNNAFIKGLVPSQDNTVLMGDWYVDYEYFETMGMEFVEGRGFSRDFPTDSNAVVINESALRQLEWENPIGETIGSFTNNQGDIEGLKVIGVVKDFHFESLRSHITPLLLRLRNSAGYLNLKVQTNDYAALTEKVGAIWDEMAPNQPYETSFLDERFSRIYDAEQRTGNIFGVFAGLAVFIACLGLFGLAAYTAENRLKEVGIRKVLGASVGGLVYLLSKEMGKLVLYAFLIFAPLAYFFMDNWLLDFQYRTNIGIWVFAITMIGALLIAVLTMSYQSLRAATSNPIKSLRTE